MDAIWPKRQRRFRHHSRKRQRRIKMGEEITAARGFKHELFAQRLRIDGNKQQIGLAGEMAGCGLAKLGSGREMHEAIGVIHRGTIENASLAGLVPQILRDDLIYDAGQYRLLSQIKTGRLCRKPCCLSMAASAKTGERLPNQEEVKMQIGLFAVCLGVLGLPALSVLAQQPADVPGANRYHMERTEQGFIRLDQQTGAVSYCREEADGLACRLAADERAAFEQELDILAKRVDALEKRLDAASAPPRLPNDAEVEKTLSIMERFMRRFMAIIGESAPETAPAPNRT